MAQTRPEMQYDLPPLQTQRQQMHIDLGKQVEWSLSNKHFKPSLKTWVLTWLKKNSHMSDALEKMQVRVILIRATSPWVHTIRNEHIQTHQKHPKHTVSSTQTHNSAGNQIQHKEQSTAKEIKHTINSSATQYENINEQYQNKGMFIAYFTINQTKTNWQKYTVYIDIRIALVRAYDCPGQVCNSKYFLLRLNLCWISVKFCVLWKFIMNNAMDNIFWITNLSRTIVSSY